MARRPSKHLRSPRPLRSASNRAGERKSDGEWITQRIAGERAIKTYLCPGCLSNIYPGTAHVVAWPKTPPLGSQSSVEYRRHWHSGCWGEKR